MMKRLKDGLIFICFFKLLSVQKFKKINLLNILRKEVIQPQVPLRLPCYDFTPVTDPTVVGCLLQAG